MQKPPTCVLWMCQWSSKGVMNQVETAGAINEHVVCREQTVFVFPYWHIHMQPKSKGGLHVKEHIFETLRLFWGYMCSGHGEFLVWVLTHNLGRCSTLCCHICWGNFSEACTACCCKAPSPCIVAIVIVLTLFVDF